jgi:two-component system, chemotaxis family, chemotaxis protein CheY
MKHLPLDSLVRDRVSTSRRDAATSLDEPQRQSINIKDLIFLLADSNSYFSRIVASLLFSFGASEVIEVRNSFEAIGILNGRKVDFLLCDENLPPHGFFQITQGIRKKDHANRTISILRMTGKTNTDEHRVRTDMVLTKPVSAAGLYDQLISIASSPQRFVDTGTYFGPDRRFKIEGYLHNLGRRKADTVRILPATPPRANAA